MVATLRLLLAALVAPSLSGYQLAYAQQVTINNVEHTFYGYPDNSPPGAGTAYSCGYGRGYTAGGKGTYADPLTFATAPGEFNKCEIIYDEYTRKYLVFQDTCAKCIKDWAKGIYHIDIWTGSSTVNGGKAQIQCEDALTPNQGQPVVRNDTTSTAFRVQSSWALV
ncbi:hypothetical protein BDY17DRAFT_313521 [Neohortaea acidophila]|uniref:Uncharacterized protein n=1 Tax=Neohortaea acidophila TaxID=245834 RepID=A0A6A6PJT8_9PEZI|nr:uncharacterized protein BDY17DRAFT_313521 [Neohortaea acidophila]KAF2479783.1 hypothetical protein BDY17DRAFT_313521 [Neohortaea acidophila]